MKLTPKRDDQGRTIKPPKFTTGAEGQESAITFMLNNELERILDKFFETDDDVFDLFVEVISGRGDLVIPMAVAIPGMDPLGGRLYPREDPATRDTAGGEGFHNLPMRKKEHGQETIWKLTRAHFLEWKKSREIEVIFTGQGRPTIMRVTTAPMIKSAEDLIEKGVDAFKREFSLSPELQSDHVLAKIRSLWASGIITGLQLACDTSALQSEILLREILVDLSQND